MKVRVDPLLCVGCEVCTDACPAVFKMVEDKAVVIAGNIPESEQIACTECIEVCPFGAMKLR